MNVRVACARVVAAVLRGESSLNSLIPQFNEKIPAKDANLFQELCYGTLRHAPALEIIITSLMDKPIKAKEAEVSALLMTALYQIREMRIPSHAAVNEAVSALRPLKKQWAKGLVNGVLRNYLRSRETIDQQCRQNPAFHHMHPGWLAEKLKNDWPDKVEAIMAANNLRPPMCLRVNLSKISRAAYLEMLVTQQIEATESLASTCGIYLTSPCNVDKLPGFSDGLVSVQDEAAQLCAPLLDLQAGQRVLDACCAPGGKTCHILEQQSQLSTLIAIDVEADRMQRVQENLDRLTLTAELKVADAAKTADWWDGKFFDRILLDAPCSATGVIRRHPDIKLLRKARDVVKLTALQGELLASLWPTLAPGGKLLYATCSVLMEENNDLLAQFVASQPDCEPLAIDANWGESTAFGRQLFPEPDGHDGFYYGLLSKKS